MQNRSDIIRKVALQSTERCYNVLDCTMFSQIKMNHIEDSIYYFFIVCC